MGIERIVGVAGDVLAAVDHEHAQPELLSGAAREHRAGEPRPDDEQVVAAAARGRDRGMGLVRDRAHTLPIDRPEADWTNLDTRASSRPEGGRALANGLGPDSPRPDGLFGAASRSHQIRPQDW